MLEMATPARIREIREAPVRSEMPSTSMTPAKAPRKAASGVIHTAEGISAQLRATARPAPALTPMMLGAARGLARTDWMMAPDMASAAPASAPAQHRGRRR